MRKLPTAERLRELLHYDPETGLFVWKVRRAGYAKAGTIAGSPESNGYLQVKVDRVLHKAHVLAWIYVHGRKPNHLLDHVDRDRTNNRIANLREATRAENGINVGIRKDNTSGYKGVSWNKSRKQWFAQIQKNRVHKVIGYFSTAELAARAYDVKAVEMFGEFCMNNEQLGLLPPQTVLEANLG